MEYRLAKSLIFGPVKLTLAQWNRSRAVAWGAEMGQGEAGPISHLWSGTQDMLGAGKGAHYWEHPNSVSAYYHGDPRGCCLRNVFHTHTESPTEARLSCTRRRGRGTWAWLSLPLQPLFHGTPPPTAADRKSNNTSWVRALLRQKIDVWFNDTTAIYSLCYFGQLSSAKQQFLHPKEKKKNGDIISPLQNRGLDSGN